MAVANKEVKVQYFKVFIYNSSGESVYDLEEWINFISNLELEKKMKTVSGVDARVEKIHFSEINKVWEISFIKTRKYGVPMKLSDNTAAEEIDLDEKEKVGETVHVVYSNAIGIIAVQSNKYSLSAKQIAEYISSFQELYGDLAYIRFVPLTREVLLENLKQKKYSRFNFKLSNLNPSVAERDFRIIGDAVNMALCSKAITADIDLSVSYERTKRLDKDATVALLDDIYSNPDIVVKAEAKCDEDMLDGTESKLEPIDLLNLIVFDYIKVKLEENRPIIFENIISEMVKTYINRFSEVLNASS